MSYVYIKSERAGQMGALHDLWTAGFYDPAGKFQPESDHSEESKAAARVRWLNGGRDAPVSETSTNDELRRDSEALVRLIEIIKAMDLQAERITERQQMTCRDGADQDPREDVIVGYKFKTGLWHRLLGTIAGHACAKWIQTPEGQARIKEASERAAATIEELEKARAIDWKKLRDWRATI
jgi:hypothetical protein